MAPAAEDERLLQLGSSTQDRVHHAASPVPIGGNVNMPADEQVYAEHCIAMPATDSGPLHKQQQCSGTPSCEVAGDHDGSNLQPWNQPSPPGRMGPIDVEQHALADPEPEPSKQQNPNRRLVYFKQRRQRQKQLAIQLQVTLDQRKQELQWLQEQQQQLCTRWEALQQVLLTQSSVLQMMQNMSISDAAVAQDEDSSTQQQLSPPPGPVCNNSSSPSHTTATASAQSDLSNHSSEGGPTADAADHDRSPASDLAASCGHAASLDVAVKAMQLLPSSAATADKQAEQQQDLLLKAQQWLEPIRLYTLQAAIMLQLLGKLPDNVASHAALAAAQSCPVAAELMRLLLGAGGAAQAQPGTTAAAVAGLQDSAARGGRKGRKRRQQQQQQVYHQQQHMVQMVVYPYQPDNYIKTPETVKDLCWPMNMSTWQIDDGNSHEHTEHAAKALWDMLTPEKWGVLHAAWQTMGNQLQQVQQDLQNLRATFKALQTEAQQAQDMPADSSSASMQQRQGGLSKRAYASQDDSTAHEYAAAACKIERLLKRENVISYQICGATLQLLDPIEVAVSFVSSWPYHPKVFTMFDIIFKVGQPPSRA